MNEVLRNMGARTLKETLADRFQVSYARGCGITDEDTTGIADAVKAAEESDVVVMACGGNCGWVNVTGGEGKDRCSPVSYTHLQDKMRRSKGFHRKMGLRPPGLLESAGMWVLQYRRRWT